MNIQFEKKAVLSGVIIAMIAILSSVVSAAPPTIGEIQVSPEAPAVQSSVTFTVDVTGEQIHGVYLFVQECNKNTGVCYTPQNTSMTEVAPGTYRATVSLTHGDATYITYAAIVHSEQGWQKTSDINRDLVPKSDGNTPTDNKTPAFELLLYVGAVSLVVLITFLYTKRK
ncbi:MAG: hypothetical protein QXL17_02490 [Candidatus Thermoplasmatota archaeon]